jgi:hypothetical protein
MENTDKKLPEDLFTIIITDKYIQVEHPERKTEKIYWTDITEVWMITTDVGPFYIDLWLALLGVESGCVIPASQYCNGYNQIYDIVSKYDRFNFQNVIAASCCANNERFLLWKKEG